MLHLIIGRVGSGKTQKVYELIKNKSDKNQSSVLIVPEQYSFETEKNIILYMGALAADSVAVYSFTFLADDLLRKTILTTAYARQSCFWRSKKSATSWNSIQRQSTARDLLMRCSA